MWHSMSAYLNADFCDTSPVAIYFAFLLPLKNIYSCQILQKVNKRVYLYLGQQLK